MTLVTYIRAATRSDVDFALQSAGLIDSDGNQVPDVDIITVGTICRDTGQTEIQQADDGPVEFAVFETLPGWHVNIYGVLTAAQLVHLPVVDPPPATPHVQLWT